MATHSRILAWEIPWKKEPGRLPSKRLQKNQAQLSNRTMTNSSPLSSGLFSTHVETRPCSRHRAGSRALR